jgi:uncharacterized protein (DUF924 family)
MQRFEEMLRFWFGGLEDKDFAEPCKSWFAAEPEFDAEIRRLFLGDYKRAARGEFDGWRNTGPSCLALTIVLDQFPRNMFRNDPRAYASDDAALATAEYALRTGFDREFPPVARAFFYLPFEHSENLEHQRRSVELTSALPCDSRTAAFVEHAKGHKETVERFGRFPHRNAILGRESTPEELEFLRHARQR